MDVDNHQHHLCKECPQGSIAPNKGSEGCSPCPAGTRRWSGRVCQACIEGTYSEVPVPDDMCTACPLGFVAETQGATECSTCPGGKYVYNNGQECWKCPNGQISNGGAGCDDCPLGTLPNSAQTECTSAPSTSPSSSPSTPSSAPTAATTPTEAPTCLLYPSPSPRDRG